AADLGQVRCGGHLMAQQRPNRGSVEPRFGIAHRRKRGQRLCPRLLDASRRPQADRAAVGAVLVARIGETAPGPRILAGNERAIFDVGLELGGRRRIVGGADEQRAKSKYKVANAHRTSPGNATPGGAARDHPNTGAKRQWGRILAVRLHPGCCLRGSAGGQIAPRERREKARSARSEPSVIPYAARPSSSLGAKLPWSPKRSRIGTLIVAIGPFSMSSASNSSRSDLCSSRRLQTWTIQPSPSGASLLRGMKHGSCKLETGPHHQCCSAPVSRSFKNRQFIKRPPALPPLSSTGRFISISRNQP